jgi:hypothetical protein
MDQEMLCQIIIGIMRQAGLNHVHLTEADAFMQATDPAGINFDSSKGDGLHITLVQGAVLAELQKAAQAQRDARTATQKKAASN